MLKLCRNKLFILCSFLCLSSSTLLADIIDDIEELQPKKVEPKKPVTPKPTGKPATPSPPVEELIPQAPLPQTHTSAEDKEPSSEGNNVSPKKSQGRPRREAPIHLQSEGTSTYSRNGAMVHLQKNVVITQDDLRLQSDEAKVQFRQGEKKAGDNAVQQVEVNGKVNLSRFAKDPAERITARSDKAVFDNSAQKVTLDGNARLWKDGHLVKGDRIVYEVLTGMIKVDRAQGVVQPEKAKK